jgi:hypothetical protein
LNELYEQMDFILSGGALKLLVDFLTSRVEAALILEPRGPDLEVLDAVKTHTDGLILKEGAAKLASAFSGNPPAKKFETDRAPIDGSCVNGSGMNETWSWAVRVRGTYWTIYVLLREEPKEDFLADLAPCAGLISLWQTFHHIDVTEDRLAHLSYIILATKNTLASIFEPMPLTYFAAFLSDVLRESLFPRSISIFSDNGSALSFFEGDEREAPERKGIFAQEILLSAPVVTHGAAHGVTHGEDDAWQVVLPLTDARQRFFCVGEWDHPLSEETLNFLELLGNLATRALSINRMRSESSQEQEKVSSADFTIFSLSKALTMMQEQKELPSLLSLAADIISELNPESDCFFVVWDRAAGGYVPAAYHRHGISTRFSDRSLPASEPARKSGKFFFDLGETPTPRLFGEFGLNGDCPWPEMADMRYVFSFQEGGYLGGFVALSEGTPPLSGQNRLAALQIMVQFVAFELRKFIVR